MRKLYTTLLIMLLCVVSGYAQDTFEKDGLRYRITNSGDTPGEVWVTQSSDESDGYKGDITIPAEVLYDKTYKVTGIDSKAFKDCTDLTSVIIGNNVKNIDWQAFMNCEGLTSVTIPSSVTNISSDVFQNCTSLESVTIPNSVTSLGGGAFSGCIKLSTVTLSDKLETIESSLFSGCERLESITIPNSVTTIGDNAFSGCSKLSEVNLSNKLKTIQWDAFYCCSSLESIVIPSTVTKIGDGIGSVFSGCTKLSSVNIPDGVKTIEGSTFSGCESLSSINIPSSVTKIEGNAFSGCKSLTSIIIPDDVTIIGSSAFSDCKSLSSINIPSGVTKIEGSAFSGCESLSTISIPDGVTTIGGGAFSDCKSLTSIIIPNGVTKIEGSTFFGCESLSSISIPDGVTTIEEWAFSSCTSLPSIIIPSSVEAIGNYAFYNCPSLQLVISEISEPFEVSVNWYSNEATLVVPEGKRTAYKEVNGWKDFAITLEKGDPIYDTKKTDDQGINYQLIQTDDYSSVYYSVEGHSDALKTEIVIPDALGGCPVKTIGEWAFNGTSLTSIIIPNSVTSIGSRAFQSCSSLTLITSEIAEPFDVDAFDGTTYDKATLVVPNGKINAYKEKNGWNNFTIIVEEDESVYANEQTDEQGIIYKLRQTADRSVYYAVTGCTESLKTEIAKIVIPASLGDCPVKTIEGSAFYGCSNLTSVTIPSSVSINSNPFNDCVSLNDVIIIIKDFAEFCNNHILGGFDNPMGYYDNDSQTYITRYVNVHLKDSEGTEIIDYVIPEGVTAIGGNAFKGCANLTSVTIPNSVTSIGSYAFSNCTKFTSITIPSSVTSIGEYAFSECNSVKVVTSKISEPFEMSWSVFNGWQNNATLVVPVGKVNAYKEKSGWNGFAFTVEEGQPVYDVPKEQTDDQGISYWLRQGEDNSVYYSVTGHTDALKTEIEIPADLGGCPVKVIDRSAFRECSNLTSVTFGDNLTTIGWDAFYNCSSLTSITLPSSVTTIEGNAFSGCSSLTSITLPGSVTINNSNPFYNCTSLTDVKVVVTDYAGFCNNQILGRLENPKSYYDGSNWYTINITLHVLDNEGNEITDYVVPEGVSTIGKSAFKGYTSLSSITIPNSVTTIGDGAFYGCSNLSSITIPNSVTTIGDGAFYGCSNLIRVTSEISTPFDVNAFDFNADPLGLIDASILIVPKGSRSAYKDKSGWGFAYTFEKGETIYDRNQADKQGLKYTLNQANDGSFYYSVTGHSEDMNSEIVIPAEISGCPVKAIGGSFDMYNSEGAAFYKCSDLTSVKLGKNVSSIGDYAFFGCTSLNSITLSKKLESIGNYAFSGEDSYRWSEGYKYVPITSIVIPGSVKTIGNGAFSGCRELVSISFEKVDEDEEGGLTSIGDEAFRSCSFPSITLPKSVKTIGWGAFVDNLLTTVTLGDAITEIKRETFYNCSDLASVTIPDGVTSIEERAFEGCGKLTSVKLPKSLTSMGENVFNRCPLTSIELPDAFTVIPANLFTNNNLKYIRLGNNVQSIGKNAFGSKLGGDMSYYNNESDSEELIVIEIGTSTPPQIDKKAFPNLELSDINVIVPDQAAQSAYRSADVWGEMQLSNQNNFAEVTVETAGNIGSELRSKCKMEPSKVVNLKVNGTINAKDFSQMKLNMNSLLRLDLSDCDITEIPNEALSGKAQLQELKLPTKLKTIGQSAFKGCTYLTGKLDLPSVTTIGDYAFQGTNYTEVSLPRSLKTIGAYAFYNLPLEQRLEIPSGVTSIGDYAFADTHIHSRLELPDDVNLGAGAFKNTNISKLQLPRNIKSLSREAFQGCTNLEEADFSNTFTEVFDCAFDGCSSMTYVRLSANTTYLGEYTFRDTQLEYLNVPSNVEVIKQGLLKNCKNLQSLSLPANVQTLETEALSGCSGLRNMSVEAIVPPTVKKNAFRSINTDLCLISIPTQSIDLYGNADYWGRFVNMRNDIAVETEGNGEIAFESVEEGEEEGSSMSRTRGQRIAAARAKTRASGEEEGDLQWTVANNGSSVFVPKYGKVRFFITPAVGETITSATLDGVDITNDIVDGEYVATADNEHGKLVVKFSGDASADDPTDEPTQIDATPVSIKISSAKQVTYMSDKNLDFTAFPDLKAYVATGYDKASGTIWLTRVKEVPANTGILLMGESGTYEIPAKTGASTSYYMNLFKGTIEGTTIYTTDGNYTNYYLSNGESGVGFYKVTKEDGVKLAANRSYLSIPTDIPTVGSTGGTETIKVSAAGQVPYCNSQSLDFSSLDAQGVKAYTATGYDYSSGTIWLTRVKQVPAETGILIMAPQGEYQVPTASVASVYGDMFRGTLSGTTIFTYENIDGMDYINYYLSNGASGVGFYRVTKEDGVSIGANRCYLPILNRESAGTRSESSEKSQITFEESDEVIGIPLLRGIGGDDDGTTSIKDLTPALSEGEGEWYTLQGQRVAKPGKGVYIRNGKKVVIK